MCCVRPMRRPRWPSGYPRSPTFWGEPATCKACKGGNVVGQPTEYLAQVSHQVTVPASLKRPTCVLGMGVVSGSTMGRTP